MEIKKFLKERIYLLTGIMGILTLLIPIMYFRFHEFGQPDDHYIFATLLMFLDTRSGNGINIILSFKPDLFVQLSISIVAVIIGSAILIIAGVLNNQKIVQYTLPAVGLILLFLGLIMITNTLFAGAVDDGITFLGLPGFPLRFYYQTASGEFAFLLPHIGYYLAIGFGGASALKYLFYGKPKE